MTDYSRPLEIPPRPGTQYSAFCDPSGGRHDHFCLCIGHREGKGTGSYFVADVVRGVAPPFDPESVVAEFATLLKDYKVHTVTGDNYAASWVETSSKAGIKYIRSELNKSQLYLEALPQFMRQAISLPNHPKLLRELRLLERRTSRMGKDQVDHGAHGSDDYANALCGALRSLTRTVDVSMAWVSGDADETVSGKETHAAMMLKSYLARQGVIV